MLQGIASPLVGAASVKSERPEKGFLKPEAQESARSSFQSALGEKLNRNQEKPDRASKEQERSGRFVKSERSEKPERPDRSENKETKTSNLERSESKKATEDTQQRGTTKNSGQTEKKSSSKQQQLKEFMDSFESEFQVSPTRLVESIAELSDADLLKSPEETVDSVIANLGLPSEEDEEKAKAMYMALISKTSGPVVDSSMASKLALGNAESLQSQETLLRSMNADNIQQKNMQKIDSINGKFWNSLVKDQKVSDGRKALEGTGIDEQALKSLESNISLDEVMRSLESENIQINNLMKSLSDSEGAIDSLSTEEKASVALAAALGVKLEGQEGAVAARHQAVSPERNLKDLLAELQSANKDAELAMKDLLNKAADAGIVDSNVLAENTMSNSQSFSQDGTQGDSSSLMSGGKDHDLKLNSKKFDDFQNSLANFDFFGNKAVDSKTLQAAPLAAAATSLQTDKAEAMQKIIQSAQLLTTQGGGEMKVELNSAELGVVNLKVAMADGKLSVHMAAQSDDAKKALESSLAELKTSLAAQKLSMDNVKIDVVDDTKMSSSLQNQLNQGGADQQHQQTRQFWNQFHNNFGDNGRNDSWTEMTGVKHYARRADPLAPLESAPSARSIEGKGSGLNLVA